MRDTELSLRRRYRVAIPIAAFALYIVPLTTGWLGTSAVELVALPVGATATFWGIRWGALSAALGIAVGALSYQASGIPPAEALTAPHLVVVGLLTWAFGSMYGSLRASRRSTADLDRTHAALRVVLADAPITLTAYDTEGRFTMREGRVLEAMGERSGDRVGEDAHDVFAALYPTQPQLIGYLDQALAGEEASGSIDVSGRSERVQFRPIRDRRGTLVGAVGVAIDDTESSRSRDLLEHRALHDPLTGLPNRDLFLDRLTQELATCRRSGSPFATVMVDLDRFKTVNDRFGHAAGDAVLLAVSAELSHAIRETDTAARLGGDEFALVLEHVDHVIAGEIMLRVTAAILRALRLAGLGVDLGVSCGIAMYPQDGLDNDTLLQHADEAMYSAKRTQRAFLFWSD